MILIASALFLAGASNAQQIKEADVPSEVKQTFEKMHPGTKVSKWEKEENDYEAEFEKDKVEHSVLFNAKGKMLQTEMEIDPKTLPAGVNDYIAKNMAGKHAKEASKITSLNGVVTYEAEIDGTDYLFDDKGNFLKKETDTEKDDDDKKKK